MQHNLTEARVGTLLWDTPELSQLERDVTQLRIELEPAMAAVLPLLARIGPLVNRAGEVADRFDGHLVEAHDATYDLVLAATGAARLSDVFDQLATHFPKGYDTDLFAGVVGVQEHRAPRPDAYLDGMNHDTGYGG